MTTIGQAVSQEAVDTFSTVLQSGASTDGNGTVADATGLSGAQSVEILSSGAGTTSVTFEGSFDGVNWYAIGYYQIDGVVAPGRSVAAITVTGTFAHVYALADPYPKVRARMSGTAGAVNLTATLRTMAA